MEGKDVKEYERLPEPNKERVIFERDCLGRIMKVGVVE